MHSLVLATTSQYYEKFASNERIERNLGVDAVCDRIMGRVCYGQRVILDASEYTVTELDIIRLAASPYGGAIIDVRDADNFVFIRDDVGENQRRYDRILIVGDIHGNLEDFESAIHLAEKEDSFMILLGDVLDYGEKSLQVVDRVYELVSQGKAVLIRGNHEQKIMKWISKPDNRKFMRLSSGNRITTQAISKMVPYARTRWENRYMVLMGWSKSIIELDGFFFAHAGINAKFWSKMSLNGHIREFAMYGEFIRKKKTFNWTNDVPARLCVVVGHSVRSKKKPVQITNGRGGTTVFLDTGSGKGGVLSGMKLVRENDKLVQDGFVMFN